MTAIGPYAVEERVIGDTVWIAIRARSWLTPAESCLRKPRLFDCYAIATVAGRKVLHRIAPVARWLDLMYAALFSWRLSWRA